jgi:hypothetical protein
VVHPNMACAVCFRLTGWRYGLLLVMLPTVTQLLEFKLGIRVFEMASVITNVSTASREMSTDCHELSRVSIDVWWPRKAWK